MSKTVVITSYDMTKFYGAGIFQTTIAYATAFQKLGYNVKLLLAHGTPLADLKVDPEDKLVWLGLEYISIPDLDKLEKIDYMIYMGASEVAISEGGTGLYEKTKAHSPDCKIIYASFYNVLVGIIDGLTDDNGYLSVGFGTFSRTFDEVWILESHDFGHVPMLEKSFKKVRTMPLLVFEPDDYIHEYHNNKIPPVELTSWQYDPETADQKVLLNLDPNSKLKHTFFTLTSSLDWLREEPGRHFSVGNAYPLWVTSDSKKYDKIYDFFKKYMSFTLTEEEFMNMVKQTDNSLIWFYDRHPTPKILNRTKAFAVVITQVTNYCERWNVLLMDLFRMGVPVIHNFPDITAGWRYTFPDADSIDNAIRRCHEDIFETEFGYAKYVEAAQWEFREKASFRGLKDSIAALLD